MNQPKTVAYVVRVDRFDPPPSVLWKLFLADAYEKYSRVADADRQEAQTAWMDEIKASIGLKWERKADRPRQP